MALGEALTANTAIVQLDLSKNNLCCDGAYAIAQAVDINSSLQALDLSDNSICYKVGVRVQVRGNNNNGYEVRAASDFVNNICFKFGVGLGLGLRATVTISATSLGSGLEHKVRGRAQGQR